MTEKRAQIAFAPVKNNHVSLFSIRQSGPQAKVAIGMLYDDDWPGAEKDGWRIRKVKIEVVDD